MLTGLLVKGWWGMDSPPEAGPLMAENPEGVSQQIFCLRRIRSRRNRPLKFHIFLTNSMGVPSIPEKLCPFSESETTRFSMSHCQTLNAIFHL